jgi:hypothetical protein
VSLDLRSRAGLHACGWVVAACCGCASPAVPPDPPSGGNQYVLDYEQFVASVSPVLDARGCSASGDCHGGGIRGTYELTPLEAKDLAFDFEQTRLQVAPYDLLASPILMKPLADSSGGVPHSFKTFADTSDAGYRTIREWIEAGEFR